MRKILLKLFATTAKHGEDGLEHPDPRPIEIPANAKRPESLASMVARMVQNEEFKRALARADGETIDEANDFDIDDDHPEDVHSQHEHMARAIMEDEDVRQGRADYAQRRARDQRGGRKVVRGEDAESDGRSRRVRRDESAERDDDDGEPAARRRSSAGEGRGRRDDRGEDGERD